MAIAEPGSGRVYGYARVSSKEQNLDRQLRALSSYVQPDNILSDKASGKDLNRESYQALKGALGLRAGDTLYICSLDRLSRNKVEIKKELEWFRDKKIRLKVLDLPTTMVDMPEQERIMIRKRQREGIDAAKAKGKHLGRPKLSVPENFPEVYKDWKAGKYTARYSMQLLSMSSSSFYRTVRAYEGRKM